VKTPISILLLLLAACGGGSSLPQRQEEAAVVPQRFEDLVQRPSRETYPFPDTPEAVDGVRDDGLEVVARLQLSAPRAERFVLHGTLPVPRDLGETREGRTPLALVERRSEMAPIPAQVSVVSRYPTGEPDVVQVAALVERPEGRARGDRLSFDVLRGSFPTAPAPASPAVTQELFDLAAGPPILLRTRDVYGNVYELDLRGDRSRPGFGSLLTLKSGAALRQRRAYSTLVPSERSGGGDPLPHLMGVHAYFTEYAGDSRVSLDLRVNNGATPGSRPATPEEEPAGIVYWDALELVLPPGWRARPLVDDPFLGEPRLEEDRWVVPLVRAHDGGELHMMGPQMQFARRLTLVPDDHPGGGHAALEGLAFCVEGGDLWSWWNPRTARYFPQRTLIANWGPFRRGPLRGTRALEARVMERRNRVREALETGSSRTLISGPLLGWAHPLGVAYQGMTGGWATYFIEGQRVAAAASAAGVEALMLEHRMTLCRQAEAQWNRFGEAVGVELWLDSDGRIPFDFRTNGRMVPPCFRLPLFGGTGVSRQVHEVHQAKKRPPYDKGSPHRRDGRLSGRDDDLHSWMPNDGQHMVRVTRLTKALVWLADDPLARDDLRLSGELFHLMLHEHEHVEASWSKGVTLRQRENLAAAYPHHGLPMGRDEAWGIDSMCAAYSVADEDWRARHRDWYSRVARLLVDGAMPSGLIERVNIPKILAGRYDGAQAFECMFLLHAQRCLIESVLRGTDEALRGELEDVHQRSLEYLFWGPAWARIPRGEGTIAGPRWHFAVAPKGGFELEPYGEESGLSLSLLPPDAFDGGVETTYVWAPLEYGMLIAQGEQGPTLNDRYLRRTLACADQARRWEALLEGFFKAAERESNDNSGNWAGLVGRIQSLRK